MAILSNAKYQNEKRTDNLVAKKITFLHGNRDFQLVFSTVYDKEITWRTRLHPRVKCCIFYRNGSVCWESVFLFLLVIYYKFACMGLPKSTPYLSCMNENAFGFYSNTDKLIFKCCQKFQIKCNYETGVIMCKHKKNFNSSSVIKTKGKKLKHNNV